LACNSCSRESAARLCPTDRLQTRPSREAASRTMDRWRYLVDLFTLHLFQSEAYITQTLRIRSDQALRMSAGSNISEADALRFPGWQPLRERLLEGPADGHHLAHRFICVPRPARRRNFSNCQRGSSHHVSSVGSKQAGSFGDIVFDFIKETHCQFRGDFRDRKSGALDPARNCAIRADSFHDTMRPFRD